MDSDSAVDRAAVRAAVLDCDFEELVSQVLDCERDWALIDRIDLDLRLRAVRMDTTGRFERRAT